MATTWLLSDSIYHQWVAPYASGIAQVMPISAGYTANSNLLNNISPLVMSIEAKVRLQLIPPPTQVSAVQQVVQRLVPNVVITLPTPVIVNGLPISPANIASFTPTISALEGTGHLRLTPDPTPIWNSTTSSWTVAPPPSGVGDNWWSVQNLVYPNAPVMTLGVQATVGGGTLTPGTYTYLVTAFDYDRVDPVNPLNVISHASESFVGLITVVVSGANNAVHLQWNPVPGATGYIIYGRGPSYNLITYLTGAFFGTEFYDLGSATFPDPVVLADTGVGLNGSWQLTSWPVSLPSTGPAWTSTASWGPMVRSYAHLGNDGRVIYYPRAVHFSSNLSNHMWTSVALTQPFTWIVVAIPVDFNTLNQTLPILDVGDNPATGGYAGTPALLGSANQQLSEAYGYRVGMKLTPRYMLTTTDPSGTQQLRTQYPHNAGAKMFYSIYNTTSSQLGHISPGKHYFQAGATANNSATMKMLLGRMNGTVGRDFTADMYVLEIRRWNRALSQAEILEQYAQLSASYQFGSY